MRWVIPAVLLLAASGCAQVSVHALTPTGAKDGGKPEGLPYYLPKPYLLVVSLPPEPASSRAVVQGQPPKKEKATDSGDETSDSSKTSTAPTSDLSFAASTRQYAVKLIYLPDMSKPYAVSISAGLGTAQMNAQLQDGWMLTSLNGSNDSKIPETLTALAALASSIGGAVTGGGGAKPPDKGAGIASTQGGPPYFLHPGLYEFEYDPARGVLTGLKAITYFCDSGPSATMCKKPATQ